MKVRTDYVSNSSSSSFVLVGKIFDDLDDLVKQLLKSNAFPENIAMEYEAGDITEADVIDTIYDIVDDVDVQLASYDGFDTNEVCIGLDPSRMKDNETLGEFKEKVLKRLVGLGLKAKKLEIKFVTGGSDASGCSFFGDLG